MKRMLWCCGSGKRSTSRKCCHLDLFGSLDSKSDQEVERSGRCVALEPQILTGLSLFDFCHLDPVTGIEIPGSVSKDRVQIRVV